MILKLGAFVVDQMNTLGLLCASQERGKDLWNHLDSLEIINSNNKFS